MSTSLAAAAPVAPAAGTRLSLLGRFHLEQDGRALRLPARKEESLLAYLVLRPGSHSREVLAELYWGDSPEEQARGSLRAALAGLRAALGPGALLSDRAAVQLNPDMAFWVDVLEFRAQATRFLGDAAADPGAFDPGMYRGELLEGHYDDWVLAERERLRQLYLDALLHRVARLRALARYDEAIAAARGVLATDQADERGHRHLIYLFAITGNRPAALRQLEACRRSLKEELDVEPSAETLALLDTIPSAPHEVETTAAATVAAAGGTSTAAVPEARLTNLPIPLTSFVGRECELEEVTRLLQEGMLLPGGCRLVTLTGAGGSGKTRLAIQVARSMIQQWRHGAWWVDLSALQAPDLLPETVLAAFDMAPPLGRAPLHTLTGFLRERGLLLVLDNCEHLRDACAHLVTSVLGSCPHVQVLATSREPLGVPGEQLWPVPTFSVPAASDVDAERLLDYDAVLLFVQRARMHRPAFELTKDNAGQVAEICRRLDGIPLAIELAAARARTMSLDDILTRLQKRLRLLASGSALAPPRHKTLRASIDWTYNQLTPAECLLLQRLAVFAGGCTLAVAEAICAGGELPAEDVLDVLGRLVDRSLVVAEGGRYRMLETIREYALERLADSGQAGEIFRGHAEYFLALAEAATVDVLSGPEQGLWVRRLEDEHNNIRAALGWALAGGAATAELALRLAGALSPFWDMRGYVREGRRWIEQAIENAANSPGLGAILPAVRAGAFAAAGQMCRCQADHETARTFYLRALTAAEEAGDRPLIARCCLGLGLPTASLGNPAEGRDWSERALALMRELGDRGGVARCLESLAAVFRTAEQWEQACAAYEESLALRRQTGDRYGAAQCLRSMAYIYAFVGDHARAGELAAESLAMRQEMGDKRGIASCLTVIAYVAFKQGRFAEALDGYMPALKLFQELGERNGIATCLHFIAVICPSLDQPNRAACLMGATSVVRHDIYDPTGRYQAEFDQAVARARSQLGDAVFEQAWEQGAGWPPDQAIAYALEALTAVNSTARSSLASISP